MKHYFCLILTRGIRVLNLMFYFCQKTIFIVKFDNKYAMLSRGNPGNKEGLCINKTKPMLM